MNIIRYHYFIKKVAIYGTYTYTYHCIRVPEGYVRIPELIETYKPIGWNVLIQYPFHPSEQEEVFQLKKKFQAWDHEFTIEMDDPNCKKLA